MSKQILAILKSLPSNQGVTAETRYNAYKEELQYYVLNFIYHHPKYSQWVMYGGSALRIIHGLNRMSVDLDFEISHPVSNEYLESLKTDIEDYFVSNYGSEDGFLGIKTTNERGLTLKFLLDDELSAGHPSKQVHVKIDLNHFVAPKTVTERRSINHSQLSFSILTYNLGALMASKLAAIFLRGKRSIGGDIYDEKGRDIYDLLWYMGKKIVPDFDYLNAKVSDVKDLCTLFDKLTLKMNTVNPVNLKHDLVPLFVNRQEIDVWLSDWFGRYLRLLDDYRIHNIGQLKSASIFQDLRSNNWSFFFWYNIEGGGSVRIAYTISDYWIDFNEGDLSIVTDDKVNKIIEFSSNGSSSRQPPKDKLLQYATLFYQKTEQYFQKTNRVMLGDSIATKVIRLTADNLNQQEQIVLNKSALESCELDDLLL